MKLLAKFNLIFLVIFGSGAYAATEVFNDLHRRYPDYSYKEATLNPTNLQDRATGWEADLIYRFRNKPDQTEYTGGAGHAGWQQIAFPGSSDPY